MELALNHLTKALTSAAMNLSHVARLTIYSTNVEDTLKNFDLFGPDSVPLLLSLL